MSATGLQMNWTNVSFAGASLTHITSVALTMGGTSTPFMGDGDHFPVVMANTVNAPGASITSGDVASLMGIANGVSGTLLATQLDALQATGGAINWTMINCEKVTTDDTGQWGTFGSATATFLSYSSDGVTPPLSFTRS